MSALVSSCSDMPTQLGRRVRTAAQAPNLDVASNAPAELPPGTQTHWDAQVPAGGGTVVVATLPDHQFTVLAVRTSGAMPHHYIGPSTPPPADWVAGASGGSAWGVCYNGVNVFGNAASIALHPTCNEKTHSDQFGYVSVRGTLSAGLQALSGDPADWSITGEFTVTADRVPAEPTISYWVHPDHQLASGAGIKPGAPVYLTVGSAPDAVPNATAPDRITIPRRGRQWTFTPDSGAVQVLSADTAGVTNLTFHPAYPGVVDLEGDANGYRKPLSIRIPVAKLDLIVTADKQVINPGDSVLFTASKSPSDAPITLGWWSWREDGQTTAPFVCSNQRWTCKLRIDKSGWMRVAASKGVQGTEVDSVRVYAGSARLIVSGPQEVMAGDIGTYVASASGASTEKVTISGWQQREMAGGSRYIDMCGAGTFTCPWPITYPGWVIVSGTITDVPTRDSIFVQVQCPPSPHPNLKIFDHQRVRDKLRDVFDSTQVLRNNEPREHHFVVFDTPSDPMPDVYFWTKPNATACTAPIDTPFLSPAQLPPGARILLTGHTHAYSKGVTYTCTQNGTSYTVQSPPKGGAGDADYTAMTVYINRDLENYWGQVWQNHAIMDPDEIYVLPRTGPEGTERRKENRFKWRGRCGWR